MDAPSDPPANADPDGSADEGGREAGADASAEGPSPDAEADGPPPRPDAGGFAPAPALTEATNWKPCGPKLAEHFPTAVAHAPSGNQLLVAHGDGLAILWTLTGDGLSPRIGHYAPAHRVAFSHDGLYFAVAYAEHIRVARARDRVEVLQPIPLRSVRALQFSPTASDHLLVAGDRPTGGAGTQVWRITASATALQLGLVGELGGGTQVAFGADGSTVLVLDGGETVSAARPGGGTSQRTTLAAPIEAPVVSPDGRYLAGLTVGQGQIALYRVPERAPVWTVPVALGRPDRLVFVPGGRLLALGGQGAAVHALADGSASAGPPLPARLVDAEAAPDGSSLAGITDDGRVIRIHLADGMALPMPMDSPLPPHLWREVRSLAFADDGRALATCTGGLSLVWNVPRLLPARGLGGCEQMVFAPGSAKVGKSGDSCRVFDFASESSIELDHDHGCQRSLAFSPDGKLMAGVRGYVIGIFAADGTPARNQQAQVPDSGVGFSPDGKWLASSSHELWSTSDWKRKWSHPSDWPSPSLEDNEIDNTVAFSSTGKVLTSSSWSSKYADAWTVTSKLFDLESGRELPLPMPLGRQPSFSPNGEWITSGAEVVHLPSKAVRKLEPATQVSRFLPDGRIVGAQARGILTFYCPQPL